jgi:hypothetical protein
LLSLDRREKEEERNWKELAKDKKNRKKKKQKLEEKHRNKWKIH